MGGRKERRGREEREVGGGKGGEMEGRWKPIKCCYGNSLSQAFHLHGKQHWIVGVTLCPANKESRERIWRAENEMTTSGQGKLLKLPR